MVFKVFVLAFSALFCTRTQESNALLRWCRFLSLKYGNPFECDYYGPYISLTLHVLNDNEHSINLHTPNKPKFFSKERNKCYCMCKLVNAPVLDTQVLKWSSYFTPVGCSTRRCYPHYTHIHHLVCLFTMSTWCEQVRKACCGGILIGVNRM